jgi:proteasome lid subunit RPN8/RPN11
VNEKPLILPEELTAQILADAAARAPEEACGLVGGRDGVALLVLPVTNRLHSATHFEMEPLELMRSLQRIEEEEGLELEGIYHSHPGGGAQPSESDRAEFYYSGVAMIIVAPDEHGEWRSGIYWS